MDNVAHLAATIQHLLGPTADRLAKETGCIKRERAFTGSSLVQALVFGWMNEPMSTLSELAGAAATVGAGVSLACPQSLVQSGCESRSLW